MGRWVKDTLAVNLTSPSSRCASQCWAIGSTGNNVIQSSPHKNSPYDQGLALAPEAVELP